MDSSFTVRPRDAMARTPAVGRRNAVRTELSPSQSVNATQPANPSQHSDPESLSRDPKLDPYCQSLLDREREQRQKRRDRAMQARLRQQAYGRNTGAAYQDTPPLADDIAHTDIEV